LQKERYMVASTVDLTRRPDVTMPASKGDAYQSLERYLASNPQDRGLLQVVPLSELQPEP
jgi:hypothetical protein